MRRFAGKSLLIAVVAAGLAAVEGTAVQPASAGGACRGFESTAAYGDSVGMTDILCFSPTVLYVEPGDTVTWTNGGKEPHTVTGATIEWGDLEEIPSGAQVAYRFDVPGTYPYYCFTHPGMTGAIVVGDGVGANVAPGGPTVTISRARATGVVEPLSQTASSHEDDGTLGSLPAVAYTGIGALVGAAAVASLVVIRRRRHA